MTDAKMLNNAKTLRTNQTEAEQRIWYHLRAHRFMGFKFKRQKPLGHYIVDFVCVERWLIIEIDGGQHVEQAEYDQHRDAWLRNQGYTILRFWNNRSHATVGGRVGTDTLDDHPLPRPLSHQWERGVEQWMG